MRTGRLRRRQRCRVRDLAEEEVKPKLTSLALIGAVAIGAGGCGSAGGTSTTQRTVHRISLRNTPSYVSAKRACGTASRAQLARRLGLSSADPVAIAKQYAEQNAPLAARKDVFDGCYAALNK